MKKISALFVLLSIPLTAFSQQKNEGIIVTCYDNTTNYSVLISDLKQVNPKAEAHYIVVAGSGKALTKYLFFDDGTLTRNAQGQLEKINVVSNWSNGAVESFAIEIKTGAVTKSGNYTNSIFGRTEQKAPKLACKEGGSWKPYEENREVKLSDQVPNF